MQPEYELVSFHIIEHVNGNPLFTWTYPSLVDSLGQQILSRCFIRDPMHNFLYFRVDNLWMYIWERCMERKYYALCVITKSFNPIKYKQFGSHMCNIYESDFKPFGLVKVFLSAFIKGTCSVQPNGIKEETKTCEKLHELIGLFDVEIILIFNALLLKKRLFLYHPSFVVLFELMEAATLFFDWKVRNPNEYLFPTVRSIAMELKGRHFFLVGLTDKTTVDMKPESYDLLVNLQKCTVKVSPNSKDVFVMTKWHRDIATLLTHVKSTDATNTRVIIDDIHKRTADLLSNLKSVATPQTAEEVPLVPMITVEELRARKLAPAMENFLFNLAVAESIMML